MFRVLFASAERLIIFGGRAHPDRCRCQSGERQLSCAFQVNVSSGSGGRGAIQIETYFDESGSHKGSPVFCIAGYLFTKDRAAALAKEWISVLNLFEIPYFHMVDCTHGSGPFSDLSKEKRISISKHMIVIANKFSIQGLAVTANAEEYHSIMPKHPLIGSLYTFCAHGRPRRLDCASLLLHHHNALHLDREKTIALAKRFGFEEPGPDTI